MKPPFYISQLQRDLEHWIAHGFVEEKHRKAILASAGQPGARVPMLVILSGIFALIVGAGAVTALSMVWEFVPPLAKVILPVLAMWTLYGLSYACISGGHRLAGHVCLVGALLAFTLAVWAVGDVFQVSTWYADGAILFIAAIGALAAAALVPSRFALALAIVLSAAWSAAEYINFGTDFHWGFLIFWIAALYLVNRFRWEGGAYLAFAALIVWVWLTTLKVSAVFLDWGILHYTSVHALLWLAVWLSALTLDGEGRMLGKVMERTALGAFLTTLFLLSISGSQDSLFDALQDEELPLRWIAWAGAMAALTVYVVILAGTVSASRKMRSSDAGVTIVIVLFAIAYPVVYPYFEFTVPIDLALYLIPAAFFILAALWVGAYGSWRQDGVLVALAGLASAIAVLQLGLTFVIDETEYARLMIMGAAGLLAFLILLEQIGESLARSDAALAGEGGAA